MTEETITKLASIADAARSLAKAAALNGVKPEDLQVIVLAYANKTISEEATKDVVSLERGPEPTMRLCDVRNYLLGIMLPEGKTGAQYWEMQDQLYGFYETGTEKLEDVRIPVRDVKFFVNKFDPTGKIFRELECEVNTYIPELA